MNRTIVSRLEADAPIPPLHVLAYTVRAILQPTLLVAEVPRLLLVLGTIEHYRTTFMEQLRDMKRLDKQIRTHQGQNVPGIADGVEPVPLTDDERRYVIEVLKKDADMRAFFREGVNGFCQLVRSFGLLIPS